MLSKELQNCIADLIHQGHKIKGGELKKRVLESLKELIPFDMALWASGLADTLEVNDTYLYNLPSEMMESWEKVKHQDRLLQGLIKSPGRTFDVFEFYTHQERASLETYMCHSKLFHIENAISTALPDPTTGLLEILSLYRSNPENSFSASEMEVKQFLFPLLSLSWHQNQIHHMVLASKSTRTEATAICDRRAWIRHAEPEFVQLVREQWPDWVGPALPCELFKWLQADEQEPLKLPVFECSKETLGDMFLVQAWTRRLIDILTKREEEVATLFARGMTYKKIAAKLGVSPNTIRRHIESIYKKLGVTSKLELFKIIAS